LKGASALNQTSAEFNSGVNGEVIFDIQLFILSFGKTVTGIELICFNLNSFQDDIFLTAK
jgi:hypothetical protein